MTARAARIISRVMDAAETEPVSPELLYCPSCGAEVAQPLRCGDCGAVICNRCGSPLENIDELGIG